MTQIDLDSPVLDGLTSREMETAVELAMSGSTDKELASLLFIEPGTIATHLASARKRIGAGNRVQLALKVARCLWRVELRCLSCAQCNAVVG